MKKTTLALGVLGSTISIVIIFAVYAYSRSHSIDSDITSKEGCFSDTDCVLFGKTGDCNCGCYLKGNEPTTSGGECFCQAPVDCTCLKGKCEGVFESAIEVSSFDECVNAGNPVMESHPRQCRTQDGETFTEELENICNTMSLEEAMGIAKSSECGDQFKDTYMCNDFTRTWWIDLDIEKQGCNPACVINTETGKAEINWRCTGLISPDD